MIRISLKSEEIFSILGFSITNSLIMSIFGLILFYLFAIYYSYSVKNKRVNNFFILFNLSIKSTYGFFKSIFEAKVDYFYPLIGSFFFFILINNELGLFPGIGSLLIKIKEGSEHNFVPLLRGGTTDLNTTIALALITVVFAQYIGIKTLGFAEYMKKFVNFSSATAFFTCFMEMISEFSRLIAYSFRLYGNIFAGEMIIYIMAFLFPILLSTPFFLFEIFVGFIQAIVFAMLSAVFYNLAMEKSHY
jgi:F-type H+-transporting ATPase subunit a